MVMNLDKRQKMLVGAFVGVLVLWQGSGALWGIFFGPFDLRNIQMTALNVQLKKKQDAKHQLDLTERRTRSWERRSLPPNPVVASTLYHHWVLDLAEKHKLTKLSVTPKRLSTGVSNPVFTRIPVSVTAECKMDQLCQFLFDFYRTDLLHKVNHLGVESSDNRDNPTLKVSLELEGVSLASAKNRTTLFADKQSTAVSEAMSKKSIKDYESLYTTNRFVRGYNGPAKPVIPPAPPAAPFDSSPHVFLVASLEVNGQPEAWLYDRTSNQRTVLNNGKDFEISGVKGQVLEIGKRTVKLKVKEKNWQLEVGENLKQMIEVRAAGTPTAQPASTTVPSVTVPSATVPSATVPSVTVPPATVPTGRGPAAATPSATSPPAATVPMPTAPAASVAPPVTGTPASAPSDTPK